MIGLILSLALVGFVLWLVMRFVPMPAPYGQVMVAIVCILMVLWLLSHIGVHLP